MSDNIPPVTPTAATPAPPAASRGYFNKEQLEDTALAESVLTAAKANPTALATRDIDAAFLTRFGEITVEARKRATGAKRDWQKICCQAHKTRDTLTAAYENTHPRIHRWPAAHSVCNAGRCTRQTEHHIHPRR